MCDDLIDHAALQAQIRTPICLDESITSPAKTRKAIQFKACRWINIKPGRVGGLTNAVAIHNLCQEAGVPCWIGGMLESAVGAFALSDACHSAQRSLSFRHFSQRSFLPRGPGRASHAAFRSRTVLRQRQARRGAEPKPAALQRMTVEHAVFTM